jgi:hypothetical protein
MWFNIQCPSPRKERNVSDHNDAADAASPDSRKKAYTRPTLTEYGSVAKLTMAKGSTAFEISPNKKPQCL